MFYLNAKRLYGKINEFKNLNSNDMRFKCAKLTQ